VNEHNKDYEFWQRTLWRCSLFTKTVAFQKLDYTHFNPLANIGIWPKIPAIIFTLPRNFYEQGVKTFSFFKRYYAKSFNLLVRGTRTMASDQFEH
jgi:hypothetical protein